MESMMTVRQVAELLGVHENWVYDQAAGGGLPSYKIGGTRRFDPDELRGWIGEHREPENGRQRRRRPMRATSAATRAAAQYDERQSEKEQSRREVRRSDENTAPTHDESPPRLFEI